MGNLVGMSRCESPQWQRQPLYRKPSRTQFCGYLVAKIGKLAIFAILQLSFTGFVAFLFKRIIKGFAHFHDAMH